ncbi:formin-like protein 9 isoform X2 [Ananas comosus]|uniref:Formin-like protein n=1 Tax=Ananas comosus TaxID=4615 RepID=A0A6P5GYN6_ANACO|nr:formin-like protein 9 isoform X2 [Ananas comosus]
MLLDPSHHSHPTPVNKLMGTASFQESQNVRGDEGLHVLLKIRLLLGLKSSTLKGPAHHGYHYSPAPAPVEEVIPPGHVPQLHTHVDPPHTPHSHRAHISPSQSLGHQRDNRAKKRLRRIAIIVAVSAGFSAIVLGIAIVLVYKRSSRRTTKRSDRPLQVFGNKSKSHMVPNVTSKVSFDPGPELFYLNSLAPYLENDDSSLKQRPESNNVSVNESLSSSPLLLNGEVMKYQPDSINRSDEEKPPIDNSHLDTDDESFHSICCSHSSNGSVSDVFLLKQSHLSIKCSSPCFPQKDFSPSNSSDKSISPNFRSQHCIPFDQKRASNPSPRSLQAEAFQIPPTPCNQDRVFHVSPKSSMSHGVPKLQETDLPSTKICSESLKMSPRQSYPSYGSVNSTAKKETTPFPSNLDLISTPKGTPKESNTSPSTSISTNDKLPRTPPLPLRGTGAPTPPPPPPPLPPPFMSVSNRKGSNSGPPPPPPCPILLTTPGSKDGSSLPKLKPLHWDKVRAAPDRSMVWDKIRSSSFELDEKMIESLFGYNMKNSAKHEEAKNKTQSPSKHVMEHKRLQNITILLKAINSTSEQVCDALTKGNGLSVQQLEALVKMTPTKEEEEKFSLYDGDIDELDPAEKFVKVVLSIPFAFSRVQVMLYRETFEDEVAHLRKSFAMLEEACKELRSSRLFLKLLEAVLKTGNRMNVGTIRGGARAFKLDALLKLADVKGTDGKTTLLHFVVQEMIRSEGLSAMESKSINAPQKNTRSAEEREEDYKAMGLDLVSGLVSELCNVKKTASIDLDVLISSVSNLSCGMAQMIQLVEKDLMIDDTNRSFVNSMKLFIDHAEKTITGLKDDEKQVLLHVRDITEYYHGDMSKDEANPLRIFVIVRDFLCMLDRVCKEIQSSRAHRGPHMIIPFR